jgi:hypothetical protein
MLRNRIVKKLGLKTVEAPDREAQRRVFKVEKGHGLGLFQVIDRTSNEVLMGEDDRHLKFRVSFHLAPSEAGHSTFTMTTTVKINNWWGRVYFLPVKPFHKIIVPAMMKGMIKRIHKE